MKVFVLATFVTLSLAYEIKRRPIFEKPSVLDLLIVSGYEAKPGQFPYQAALLVKRWFGTALCGGSLLNDEYVLTAGHCLKYSEEITVILGAHKFLEEESSQVRILVPKANFKLHEEFNSHTLLNDIALLKLSEKVKFQDHIKPIALPRRSEVSETYTGENCTVSGWGVYSEENDISAVLRYVEAKAISNQECSEIYGTIPPTNICVSGKDGKSACHGDSGGPLTFGQGDDLKLVGVVSFGHVFGCEKGFPHGYTRVTSYLDWIEANSNVKIS